MRCKKGIGGCAAALKTGPVAGSKCCYLIEKKQLGIAVAHDVALAALELQDADDPLPRRPAPFTQGFGLGIMDPAATIAKNRATGPVGNDLTKWRYSIL